MAADNMPKGQMFHGIKYHICPGLPNTQQAELRSILNSNGASEVSEPKVATRIITDQAHFSTFQVPQYNAAIVTPQWVFASIDAGMKQPSRYYSADPAMFFTSMVVSVLGISPPHADLIRAIVIKYGGQWEATPGENVTHLIADTVSNSDPLPHLIPIVVSHAWIRDSFERESHQDIAPYVLLERKTDGPSTRRPPRPSTHGATPNPTDRIPKHPLPVLPFEIIAKIHLMCRDLALDKFESSAYINTLLDISHVSRCWRAIAHHNGPLWTHIFLDFHTEEAYTRLSNFFQLGWIARSGNHPLSMNIRSYFPCAPTPAINFLLVHASRIRDIWLRLPAAQFHQFLHLPPGSFPSLETITLSVIPKANLRFDPSFGMTQSEFFAEEMAYIEKDPGLLWTDLGAPASVFRNTPQLRDFSIDAHCGGIDPHVLHLPWASLTNINLDTVDLGVIDTREILQLIVNAVRLSFWTSSRQGPIMLPIPAFKLPIEQLVWRGLLVRDASIFAPLILPNLTSLELQDASDDSLRLLRERAPFELQELKLFFTQLTFAATAKFLRGMQSMTILELRLSIALTDELMVFLTYDARAPILPALKDLTLSDCRKYFDECTMLRMVESRWPSGGRGPRFRQVSITTRPLSLNRVRESRAIVPSGLAVVPLSTPNVRRGIMDRIAEMKEEGLSFSYEIVV